MIYAMPQKFLNVSHHSRVYQIDIFVALLLLHVVANALGHQSILLWLPEKGSHITFVWPFVHFLTLPAAVAAKLLFQFKSDLEFKCVSHLGLHLGRPNFPRQPPTF